jgi:3-hydroxymyristoyl/3-hydroxydecanoyl-(acyl carrier protein) dehydratase
MIDLQKLLIEQSIRASEIHRTFLTSRNAALGQMSSLISLQVASNQPPGAYPDTLIKPEPAALFDEYHLQEFATGSLTKCFGSDFTLYAGRRFPRIPNGDLALISRVVKINGTRGNFDKKASIESEYDVPFDAWFFEEFQPGEIPYFGLMEISLQPCGFLSAFLGTPMLIPDQEFFFRNLDGQGELLSILASRGKTIGTRANLVSTLVSGETIIQRFEFELYQDEQVFFKGNSTFGYFTRESMLKQAGLDGGRRTQPACKQFSGKDGGVPFDLAQPGNWSEFYSGKPGKEGLRLPRERLELVDEMQLSSTGGKYQKGYIYASKKVNPSDWFYSCHFFQDPVMPGSLGVEAILQAMRAFAIYYGLGNGFLSPQFRNPNQQNILWRYRGQILPNNHFMQLEIDLSQIEKTKDRLLLHGDASLWADDFRIYEIKNASIEISEPFR